MKRPNGEWKEEGGKWYKKRFRVEWEPYSLQVCRVCGDEYLTKHASFTCSGSCRAKYRWSKTDPDTRGKVRIEAKSGYIYIRLGPKKYIGEHRYKMEEQLGRKLTKSEHVHHINGNKSDNRIENLIVLDRTSHNAIHKSAQSKLRKRTIDGKFV